jgi:hypothetical protein
LERRRRYGLRLFALSVRAFRSLGDLNLDLRRTAGVFTRGRASTNSSAIPLGAAGRLSSGTPVAALKMDWSPGPRIRTALKKFSFLFMPPSLQGTLTKAVEGKLLLR